MFKALVASLLLLTCITTQVAPAHASESSSTPLDDVVLQLLSELPE